MSKYIDKITLTIAIIILFIPTIIAFIYINSSDNSPTVPTNATVTVSIAKGDDSEDINDVSLQNNIKADLNNAVAFTDTNGLPLYEGESYVMTVKAEYSATRISIKQYTCYLNSDVSQCYFKDETGNVFPFSKETATGLLKQSVCQSVIQYATAPAIYYKSKNSSEISVLVPKKINWTYINNRNEKINSDSEDENAASITVMYKKNDTFSDRISYAKVINKNGDVSEPTGIYVTVSSEDETLERTPLVGLDAMLETRDFNKDTKLTFTVEAEWGDSELNEGFYGSATYLINVIFDVPAAFEMSDATVSVGNLPLIKASNLNENEEINCKVTFASTGEEYNYPVNFVQYNGMAIAFLPFDFNAQTGMYNVDISTASSEKQLSVNIKNKSFAKTKNISNVPPSKISENYGDNTKVSFNMTVEGVFSDIVDQKLWEGKFNIPVSGGTKYLEYGQKVKINDEYTEQSYCNIYTAAGGSSVKAANNGKVVYVGKTSLTGNTVVIEHGFGYKTWYWNLNDVVVNVGDEVNKDTKLGTVGTTGFCTGSYNQVSYAVSIGNVFINPDLYLTRTMDYFDK